MATLNDLVTELRALCGNRTDLESQLPLWVNHGILALRNRLPKPDNLMFGDVDAEVDEENLASFDLPDGFDSISELAYADANGNWVPLPDGRCPATAMLQLGISTQATPTGFTQIDQTFYLLPRLTDDVTVRALGVKSYTYITDGAARVPLPDALRPAVLAVATAIARAYLGEVEIAAALQQLSTAFAAAQASVEGKTQSVSDMGVRMKR